MNKEILAQELTRDEGIRLRPYKDTVGKLTVGIGRNLDDVGISTSEAEFMLENDISKVERELDEHLPWWRKLTEERQRVLANMCFNLGVGVPGGDHGLLSFGNTLRKIELGDYAGAAKAMLESKWARQVGARAVRLAKMMDPTRED